MMWWLVVIPLASAYDCNANGKALTYINTPGEAVNRNWASECKPCSYPTDGQFYCDGLQYIIPENRPVYGRCDDDIGDCTRPGCFFRNKAGELQKSTGGVNMACYIYTQTKPCVASYCDPGTQRVGCKRYSPGECKPCSPDLLKEGHFWSVRGSCEQAKCEVPLPGWYFTSRCGQSVNAVIKQCVFYRNNPKGPDSRDPGLYYCPGGESDPVRIPDNSRVNSDFTGYTCNAGYYLVQQSCVLCPAGKYCVGGVATPCKKHYYSDEQGSTRCKRCKTPSDCTGSNCGDSIAAVVGNTECGIAPTLCAGGSIQNSNCVSCGLCGTSPQTGVECVNEYEMDGLPGFDPGS